MYPIDGSVDKAAVVLKLLYVKQLRELQNGINAVISTVQVSYTMHAATMQHALV
jgi:hypothetical protein